MSEPFNPSAYRQVWVDWFERAYKSAPETAIRAADAAIQMLDAGLSRDLAAVAARVSAGVRHPADARALDSERHFLALVAADLGALTPGRELTTAALVELQRIYAQRLALIEGLATLSAQRAAGTAPSRHQAASGIGVATGGEAMRQPLTAIPASPALSLREFITEHGILILSYLGAFLLIVATLLFEIYGTTGNDGGVRFAGVLGLNLVFGIAGFVCLARPSLRFVGRSYVAIFAVMTPLTFAAAYVFLLRPRGLDVNLAVFAAGLSCLLIYGALSVRLESRGYAALALVAAPVSLVGLFNLFGAMAWQGPLLTVLPIGLAAFPKWSSERWARLYEPLRRAAIFAYAGLASAWTVFNPDVYGGSGILTARHLTAGALGLTLAYVLVAVRERRPWHTQVALAEAGLAYIGVAYSLDLGGWTGPSVSLAVFGYAALAGRPALQRALRMAPAWLEAHFLVGTGLALLVAVETFHGNGWPVTLTLALLTAAYALRAYLDRPDFAWVVGTGVTFTVLNLVATLDVGQDSRNIAYAVAFLALGAGYGLAAWRLPSLRPRLFFRAAAVVQLTAITAIPLTLDSLRGLLLVTAAVMVALVAYESGEPRGLYPAVFIFAVSWYYLVKWLVPPPPNASADTLILSYSPLPVVYGALGAGLRRRGGKEWGLPLLVGAAGIAVLVVLGLTSDGNYTFGGRALLVYALATYLVGVIEKEAWIGWPALAAGVLGTLYLMVGAGATPATYPATFLGVAWLVYLGSFAWESRPDSALWRDVHRQAGVGIATLTVISCFFEPDFLHAGSIGAISALMALWGTAAMIAVDGRTFGAAWADYVAALLVAVGAYWLSRYAGLENPQAWVAPIGATLVGAGIVIPRDPRMANYAENARLILGLGLALLLGVTAYQTLDDDGVAATYVAVIVLESALATIVGLGFRSRVLVLGGAAGAAFGALRALLIVSHLLPLYLVFGGVALVLLVVSGLMAALRDRISSIRTDAALAWRSWSL